MAITVCHRIQRDDLALGLVRVEGIEVGPANPPLAASLDDWIARRRDHDLSPDEDLVRKASREMLRNGKYKPTGRGKPASEYLLRAARQDQFPRINGPVDANNVVSLEHCLPISLWDLDLAGADRFEFRLGAQDERYPFNPAGQMLELQDLVCGCVLSPDGSTSTPIVTPIKDSMATKIRETTTRLAGCIYFPLGSGSADALQSVTDQLERWLRSCGDQTRGATAIVLPGQQLEY